MVDLSYKERLAVLDLLSLEKRRFWDDQIVTFWDPVRKMEWDSLQEQLVTGQADITEKVGLDFPVLKKLMD